MVHTRESGHNTEPECALLSCAKNRVKKRRDREREREREKERESKRKRIILVTKITAAQNEVAVSYYRVRELYFLAVVFAAAIIVCVTFHVVQNHASFRTS